MVDTGFQDRVASLILLKPQQKLLHLPRYALSGKRFEVARSIRIAPETNCMDLALAVRQLPTVMRVILLLSSGKRACCHAKSRSQESGC
jgi:hypothetical protein